MKIHLLNDSKQGLGGAWSFLGNLEKGFNQLGVSVVGTIEESDICLCAGPTMVTRQTIDKVQQLGKKLVVRLDNVPRNSRNRNTGTSRLKEFAERADGVVWQCQWAKDYLGDFVHSKKETIIYNGIDTDIFKKEGASYDFGKRHNIYLYSRFNRDETKNWEVAWYEYQMIQKQNKNNKLLLVGNFSPEQMQYNFDFFRGENVDYLGVVNSPEEMAKILRSCGYFLATYYNDCYSNTYLEAIACGVVLRNPNFSGGTKELLENAAKGIKGVAGMASEYLTFFHNV